MEHNALKHSHCLTDFESTSSTLSVKRPTNWATRPFVDCDCVLKLYGWSRVRFGWASSWPSKRSSLRRIIFWGSLKNNFLVSLVLFESSGPVTLQSYRTLVIFHPSGCVEFYRLGHWGRTGWSLFLPREYGRSCPLESGVVPLASTSNLKSQPALAVLMDSLALVYQPSGWRALRFERLKLMWWRCHGVWRPTGNSVV